MGNFSRTLAVLFIFIFITVLVFAGNPVGKIVVAGNSPGKSQPTQPYAPGEVLVKFKKGVTLESVNQIAAMSTMAIKKHFRVLSKMKGNEFVLLKSPKASTLDMVNELLGNAAVEAVSPNYRNWLDATPNDTRYSELWGMHNTGQTGGTADAVFDAPEAWNSATGSTGTIVAVIDTGLDYQHPDLAANVWVNALENAGSAGVDDDGNGYIDDIYGIDPAGADGSTPDTDPMDGYGHGTHCAGTIGAVGNNSLGVAGVNWNVTIMGLKFMDEAGDNGYDAFAIECMEYVVWEKQYHGQNVVAINASWGGTGGSDTGLLRDAIEVVNDAGIVFCAAAGNGGADGVGDNNETTH
ncbi:MAG TPA: S8 family serine peptidase, partial [Candidatus Binatia bacterium]|nr:S8 family serine peptidase [Candidatus Binatia bacterium]